jgi:hypothetical protein
MMTDAEKRFRTFLFLDLEHRGVMFSHALVRCQLGSREAMDLLEFIKSVWAEDRQELEDIPCQSSPDRGMLKALGYRVGEAGVETAVRRLILDYLLTEDALPAIHGLGYMKAWGLASEEIRPAKLRRVLRNLADEKRFDIENDKAVREWTADIAYLDQVGSPVDPAENQA